MKKQFEAHFYVTGGTLSGNLQYYFRLAYEDNAPQGRRKMIVRGFLNAHLVGQDLSL